MDIYLAALWPATSHIHFGELLVIGIYPISK